MKTKWIALLLALLLCVQLAPAAMADPNEASALSAYYCDGSYYAFAWMPDYVGDYLRPEITLVSELSPVSEPQLMDRLIDRETPAEYLLLVDNSTSMGQYLPQIKALAEMLFTHRRVCVSVATFGEAFTLRAEELDNYPDLADVLDTLHFDEQGTDICGGVARGVDYLCAERWQTGELVQLVLVTDGVPYYARDEVVQQESKAAAAEVLSQVYAASPQAFVHLVCFANWDPETYEAVKGGNGMDLIVQDEEQASFDGGLLADWYDALYGAAYPVEREYSALRLRNEENELYTIPLIGTIPVESPAEGSILDELPPVIGGEITPDEPSEDEPFPTEPAPTEPEPSGLPEPYSTEPPSEAPTESPSDNEIPAETPGISTEAAEEPEPPAPAPLFLARLLADPALLAVCIGGVVLLIGLAIFLIVMLRRKKRTKQPAQESGGLTLQVQVLNGSLQGQTFPVTMGESLTIGSDRSCGLFVPDPGVAPMHARIYLDGPSLMIEDLNSPTGTALGGMRLYLPNALRSGDQIAVGTTAFIIRF